MKDLIKTVFDKLTGSEPVNKDIQYNVMLLQTAVKSIESGAFGHYFRKSFLVTMEIAIYSISLIAFLLGIWCYQYVSDFFTVIRGSVIVNNVLSENDIDDSLVSFIAICSKILIFMLSIVFYFWARIYTKSRRRQSLVKSVERVIKTVIRNLQ
jgi:hypothetical protein